MVQVGGYGVNKCYIETQKWGDQEVQVWGQPCSAVLLNPIEMRCDTCK